MAFYEFMTFLIVTGKQIGQETHRRYPVDFKLRLVEEAKLSTIRAVANMHGIDRTCIRRWIKQEDTLRKAISSGRMFRLEGAGRKPESHVNVKRENPDQSLIGHPFDQ